MLKLMKFTILLTLLISGLYTLSLKYTKSNELLTDDANKASADKAKEGGNKDKKEMFDPVIQLTYSLDTHRYLPIPPEPYNIFRDSPYPFDSELYFMPYYDMYPYADRFYRKVKARKTTSDDRIQEAEKELAELKKDVFGDKKYNSDSVRKYKKNIYSTKWLLKELAKTRAVELEDLILKKENYLSKQKETA